MNNHLEPVNGSTNSPFDAIKRTTTDGQEYWSARDLMPLMGYGTWERFQNPLERARKSAENQDQGDQFRRSAKSPETGGRERIDFHLTRFAAYLVAMNGDPNKAEVAAAQAYFAIRTHEAETTPRINGAELTRLELIQIALNAETERLALEAKNQKLEEFQRNIHAGNGITLTDFSKKYFGDVPARKFFTHLYQRGYLIDQRGGHPSKYGNRRHGPDHGKPTAKGRQWLYSHDHGEYGGKRRLRTRVRPERELDLRDQLASEGLPLNANALTTGGQFTQLTIDTA